jgi:hypothetical protein
MPKIAGKGAKGNRYIKMHPHLLFPESEISVYVDANIEVIGEIQDLAVKSLKDSNIAIYEHPFRKCIFEEGAACLELGFGWYFSLRSQLLVYLKNGFAVNQGMYECSVIIRRHAVKNIIKSMQDWWYEYCNGIKRDQISLPYVAWMNKENIKNLGKSDPRYGHKYFKMKTEHKRKRSNFVRIRGIVNSIILKRANLV